MSFFPTTKAECEIRGFTQPDFIIITGDGYVDHPSFGTTIIGKVLESYGYTVGIIAQPNWTNIDDFKKLGKPRLAFLISSGNVDSMVNNYSVFKNKRKKDEYSPGGIGNNRPDRAVIVYANKVREAFKDTSIIIGGIEASLRRFCHYDYWDDKLRRSILLDAKADLLVYGMGEKTIIEIAEALDSGLSIKDITWIKGTCYITKEPNIDKYTEILPTYNNLLLEDEKGKKKVSYCKSFAIQYENMDSVRGKRLVEEYQNNTFVVQNPPMEPLERDELDRIYSLPYEGNYHPSYDEKGGIPAIKEVKFSLVSSRGCFGGCSFCAITYHQGKEVRSRSKDAIVENAKSLTKQIDFKGYIHDIGGPTANFRGPSCEKQLQVGLCKHKDCLYPSVCKSIKADHSEYLEILREVRNLKGVKKVFIRSGIRYDFLLADKKDDFFYELCKHHISGTLKVAPEHISPMVLELMRKPKIQVFEEFAKKYNDINNKLNLKQYLIPYLISSHPGSTMEDAINLALYLKRSGFVPDQVQDFYPTPGTLSTCMYYTEMNPFTLEEIYVPKTIEEKKIQRALLHFNKKENRKTVIKALKKQKKEELIDELINANAKNYRR